MTTEATSRAPTGLARRGRRLSDRETEGRMLASALAMVRRDGLTVGLDHLSFEEIIRDADVARSAVYRRWPFKDLFFSDLVKELARVAVPSAADNAAIEDLIGGVVHERAEWLKTPDGRRDLVLEVFRQAAVLDFEMLLGSPEWRTYLALHATCMSLSGDELRAEVQATLAESQRGFISRVASAWAQLLALFGYRLRPEVGAGLESLATLLSAMIRGLILMALSAPDIADARSSAAPFGSSVAAEWSLAATGMAAVACSLVEPDPSVVWDEERIEAAKEGLSRVRVPLPE